MIPTKEVVKSDVLNASAAANAVGQAATFAFEDRRESSVAQRRLKHRIQRRLHPFVPASTAQAKANDVLNLANQAVIQRIVAQDFATHSVGAVPAQVNVDAYWNYVKPEFEIARKKFKDPDNPYRSHLQNLYTKYLVAYSFARSGRGTWDDVVTALNTLVPVINEGFEFSDHDDDFSNARADSHDSAEQGLAALQGVVDAHKIQDLAPARRPRGVHINQPNIPKIPWSHAKAAMPSAQKDLVWQIYLAWKHGKVLDQRTALEKKDKKKNSSNPGALRSWHMNEQAQLPDISGAAIPGNAQDLHAHYAAHSVKPYEEPAAGPIGYAEYTGTGIQGDAHDSKIVLDYKSGLVYITLTHYQLWNKATEQQGITRGNKTAGSASQSAWFCVDMTA